MKVQLVDCKQIEYGEALSLQREYHRKCQEGGDMAVLLCEHPHVYTLGKSGNSSNLLIDNETLKRINATFYNTDRGGDITYHGYGQVVGYPILNIDKLGLSVRGYVELLEDVIIAVIAQYGVSGHRSEGRTGVWVGEQSVRKICAIGVHVSRFVTMHGFALNVNSDLRYFDYINPCGFAVGSVTSLERLTGKKVDVDRVKELIIDELSTRIGCKIR